MQLTSVEGIMLIGLISAVIGFIAGKYTERRHYCFHVTPIVSKNSKNVLGIGSKTYQIGYQAQLHVRGFPCLEPHKVILEENMELKCDAEEIGKAVREIVKAAIALKTKGIPYMVK